MRTLRTGDSGPDVKALQERLLQLGFRPGTPDGKFGGNTRLAVMSFQRSRRLLVDGVAGPTTQRSLGLIDDSIFVPARSVIDRVTVDMVSRMFPGTPRANIETHLPFVLRALTDVELFDRRMVLMALATIRAETGNFLPIDEQVSRYNTSPGGRPFDLYDNRADLGNQGPPDGERYRGRGFIQLTGKDNYRRFGQRIGLGDRLIENPELANSPQISAQLMAAFLKDRELRIREALHEDRLDNARRQVNGGLNGLADFTWSYRTGETLI